MDYKMAVLDIDGTLITSKRKLTTATRAVIQKLKNKKIPVCLCTGRSLTGTMPVAKKLDLGTPFVCIDGAIMYDMYSGNFLYKKPLERKITHKLLDLANNGNMYVGITTQDRYYRYIKNKSLKKYDFGDSFFHLSKFVAYSYGVRYVKNLDRFYTGNPELYEVIAAGEPAELARVKASALSMGCDTLSVRDDLWESYVFMRHSGVQKSEGVRNLCRHFGVEMAEVVAIGDELNDLDMIKAAGMGVAMGNAKKEIKEAADYTTLTNDHDGAAAALSKLFGV